jgi:hypothetical protein
VRFADSHADAWFGRILAWNTAAGTLARVAELPAAVALGDINN